MSVISEVLGEAKSVLGVSDLFSLYKGINEVNLNKSFQNSQNYINEINANAALGRLQNQAVQANNAALNPNATNTNKYLGYGALALAAGVAVWLLVKK